MPASDRWAEPLSAQGVVRDDVLPSHQTPSSCQGAVQSSCTGDLVAEITACSQGRISAEAIQFRATLQGQYGRLVQKLKQEKA